MANQKDISVVIGFKDWGLRRVCLAVRTIAASFGTLDGEVIVSDYGSSDPASTREAVEALGARYVYTETDGVWSRTRALNAGFAVSTGRVLVATDADMVFSPRSMEVVGRWILEEPNTALLLQCRDLPSAWSDVDIEEAGLDWQAFEDDGRRRPRWGMGGMMAVARATFLRVRGYDERMHTYGGEDIDFAWRVRRAGCRLVWVEHHDVRMYHVWHPSTAARHARSAEESAAIDANKSIMREDKTFVRNVATWAHRPPDAPPLVSVVISTYNRAGLLLTAIHSIQAQTVQDFEIVVVDDGSTDNTREVVSALGDERITYVRQENAGVAAARNRGVDESIGQYIVVLDDDDVALPWRLEAQFSVLTEGVNATFGAFVNFDDDTGEMRLYRTKAFTDAVSADKGGAPGHSTWMVERELMAAIRYDENLKSGVDNNFALRAVRSGLVWRHSGRVHTLRRMHAEQITVNDTERQLASARGAYDYLTFITPPWTLAKLRKDRGAADYVPIEGGGDDALRPFLPDHLVRRSLTAITKESSGHHTFICQRPDGLVLALTAASDLTWSDLAGYRGTVSLSGLTAVPRTLSRVDLAEPGLPRVLAALRSHEAEQAPAIHKVRVEIVGEGEPPSLLDELDIGRATTIWRGEERWWWWTALVEADAGTPALLDRLHVFGTVQVHGTQTAVERLTEQLLVEPGGQSA